MKITLQQAMNLMGVPNKIPANAVFSLRLPAKISYRFGKMAAAIQREMTVLDKTRLRLIEEHGGTLPEKATDYEFPTPGAHKAFSDAYSALLEDETMEIGDLWPLDLEELGDVQLAPADLLGLDGILFLREEKKAVSKPAPKPAPVAPLKPAPKKRR